MQLNEDELRLAVAMAEVAIRAEREFLDGGTLARKVVGRSNNLIRRMQALKNKLYKDLVGDKP